MKKFQCLLLFGFLSVMLTFGAEQGHSDSIDFGTLEEATTKKQRSMSLKNKKSTLWQGNVENLQIEATTLNNELVWISATDNHLHLSRGNQVNPYPGEIKKRIPGKILSIDVNRMPHRSELILITVTFMGQNQLATHVMKYNGSRERLTTISQKSMVAVRPMNQFLYGHEFSSQRGWRSTIYQMKTTRSIYDWGPPLAVPSGALLLQMEALSNAHYAIIDESGNLIVSRGQNVVGKVDGAFGASTRTYGRYSPRERAERRQVRIAPQYLPNQQLIAVVNNPVTKEGAQSLLSGDGTSSIKFYSFDTQSVQAQGGISSLKGRITDVEVSDSNSSQLLWIRKVPGGMVKLEMIDFREMSN